MKKWIFIFLWMLALCCPVKAEERYTEQYKASGAAGLSAALPEETRAELYGNDIDLSNPNWVDSLSAQNVFTHLWDLLKSGAKTPLAVAAVCGGLMLLAAALSRENFADPAHLAATLGVILTASAPMIATLKTAVNAVKGCGTFMLTFVPVFSGVCVASGGTFTAASVHILLLTAAQAVVTIASYVILPVSGCFLAMNLCAGVSPLGGTEQTAEMLRKIAVWGLTLLTTVFVGILGIQTAVHTAADSLAMKTTKFIVGTTVPVAGQALSEATGTVCASLGLLRSSVGIFGVVAVAVILLPVTAELLLWRLSATVCGQVAAVFSLPSLQKFFKAVDQMFSLLITVVLLTGAVFMISLSVTLTALRVL